VLAAEACAKKKPSTGKPSILVCGDVGALGLVRARSARRADRGGQCGDVGALVRWCW
jgi:hypothetical protein